jgi:chromosomal replication initiation ATPase DnaA
VTGYSDLSARVEELEAECLRLRRDMLALAQSIRILRDGYQDQGDDMRSIAMRHAERAGITLAEIRGHNRARQFSAPRQAAMVAMHKAGFSAQEIGHYLGRRHYSTIGEVIRTAEAESVAACPEPKDVP